MSGNKRKYFSWAYRNRVWFCTITIALHVNYIWKIFYGMSIGIRLWITCICIQSYTCVRSEGCLIQSRSSERYVCTAPKFGSKGDHSIGTARYRALSRVRASAALSRNWSVFLCISLILFHIIRHPQCGALDTALPLINEVSLPFEKCIPPAEFGFDAPAFLRESLIYGSNNTRIIETGAKHRELCGGIRNN